MGFVVRRLRGRLPLAAAALLTVLTTTCVLTALLVLADGADRTGLRRSLNGPGATRAAVLVTGDREIATRAADDTAVQRFADDLFGPLPSAVRTVARSRAYALPGAPAGQDPDLTLLAALDRSRTRLVAGRWPAPAAAGATVEAAAPEAALRGMGLTAGRLPATLALTDRFSGGSLTVRVTGVYRPADRGDPYWRLDPLAGQGARSLGYTTYGPLLTDDSAFTAGPVAQAGRSWLITADFSGIDRDRADALRGRATLLPARLQAAAAVRIDTDLPALLDELASDALVSRSTLLVGALQLAVLAAAVLLLVVHLLAERQADENRLLAARGASRRRIGAFTATEIALLALPAVVLGPPLTPALLAVLRRAAPAAGTGTGLPWFAWPAAALCALACVLLATVPVLLRAAGAAVLRRAGRRHAAIPAAARIGADVALAALAVVTYLQLAGHTGGLTPDAGGRLGIDPLLVVAPALALCAGTVAVLRVLPLAARLGERLATRGTALGPALTGWQLARRPSRAVGPVLLLVLAVAMGMLALGQRASWAESQRDQADFATAGGLRISGSTAPVAAQGERYTALPGGDRLIPVARTEQRLPDGSGADILALGSTAAAQHLRTAPEILGGRTAAEVFGPLAAAPVTGPRAGLPLPGRPRRIEVDLDVRVLSEQPLESGDAPQDGQDNHQVGVELLVRDRFGADVWVRLPAVPDDTRRTVSADLDELTGPSGTFAAPLTVVGVAVDSGAVPDSATARRVTLHRIAAGDTATGPATAAAVPDGLGWSVRGSAHPGATTRAAATADTPLILDATTLGADSARIELAPADRAGTAAAVPEVKAVATRGYLTGLGASVGDLVRVPFGTGDVQVRVAAVVDALPTTTRAALAVDLATLDRCLVAAGERGLGPSEWWLPGTGPADPVPGRAAEALRGDPTATQSLQVRDEIAAALRADPYGAAAQAALAALALAAVVLAAIGFATATAGSAAERAGEFAVLTALGAPRRALTRTVPAQQAVLGVLGLTTGLALGALLVRLVVPLAVLTPQARRPVPAVVVQLPPGQVAVLAAVVCLALLVPAVLTGRRHAEAAARLRHLEDM
ncbi:FtsX-like permease family protein [Kitasatospora paranensis]|uniref:FtsX-like permease family protein n=1 Tax=Kitasatospora paranensis TaxID=258053 RepID=UPI00362032A0